MNPFAIGLLLTSAALLLALPRQWAPLPLLVGVCYMTLGQGIEIGPFGFTVIRVLVAVGVLRVIVRGERIVGGMMGLDWWLIVWAAWLFVSTAFHRDPGSELINAFGLAYNCLGIYFLVRIACRDQDDVIRLAGMSAILLAPVALEMINEKLTQRNFFATLGGLPPSPDVREGRIRAQGPFAHAILAGTVGAVMLPLMIGLWNEHRMRALLGITACVTMVIACASSGPIMTFGAGIVGLLMWRYRHSMRRVRWLILFGYIGLDLVMKAPAYFIIARMDIVGGSTGWHRAELIDAALRHFHEWWLWGTDYTRHWMPTGVSWSPDHTDITNEYLMHGIRGGLLLMLLFIGTLACAFSYVGRARALADETSSAHEFIGRSAPRCSPTR